MMKLIIGYIWAVFLAAASGFVWVGKIDSRVESIEKESALLTEKIERVAEDTHYIRGKIDGMRNKR